jgi:hypothetical protein
MSTSKELRFIRFRSIPEDIIGYVTHKDECIVIEMPLRVDVETIFEENRQLLLMNEYLPQSILDIQEIEFYNDEVLLIAPVKQEFVEQYEYVADFFYSNKHKLSIPQKKESNSKNTAQMDEKVEKVVSILEAMHAKKDKPVH